MRYAEGFLARGKGMQFDHLKRRDFIGLLCGAGTWPMAARAQQANRVMRVAVLLSFAETDPVAQSWNRSSLQELHSLGWADGSNIQIDIRWAAGDVDRLANLAKELIDLRPDVVLAVTTPAVNAIVQLTRSIPVVFTQVTDPVAQGLVATLARPEGNITGFAILEPTMAGKWLQILKEIAPDTTRASVIFNPVTAPYYKLYVSSIEAAAQSSAVEVFEAAVHSRDEIEATISALAAKPGSSIISMSDTFTAVHRDLIIELAARYKLPAAYGFRLFAADGGLFSYGIDLGDQHR
jgi:putative ABC transport system substrate-binding protein